MGAHLSLTHALCDSELPSQAPEWVHLFPTGPITGRDGRAWTLDDPDALIAAFKARRVDLPVDFEHQSENADARQSGPVPAAGWIKELQMRANGLWGRVDWTTQARDLIQSRAYRYLSPAFLHTPDAKIRQLKGAGLVHYPNLHLTALASQETKMERTPLAARLSALLNLPETTSDEDIIAAFQAALSAEPDPEKYVPITAMQSALADRNLQSANMSEYQVEAKVAQALRNGHITPGMKDWASALCRQSAASFDQFIANSASPFAHLSTSFTHMTASPDRDNATQAETALAASICRQLGLSETALNT